MGFPSSVPPLQVLSKVVDRLEKASIPYFLTGSMAMNFYGHPRATNDFDIVIVASLQDQPLLIKIFEKDFYVSETAVREAISGKTLFNLIDMEAIFKVDFIISKEDAFSQTQFQRKILREFQGLKAYVISPEDLILSKMMWSRESHSEMQERDIKNLMRILSKDLDYPYMEKWAAQWGELGRLRSCYVPA